MVVENQSDEFLTTQKSDIYVIPNPDATDEFLVVEGTFGVPEAGQRILIRNVTGFPMEVTFRSPIGNGTPVTIDDRRRQQFDLPQAPVGFYVYDVDVNVRGTKKRAQGGSDPRIVYG